MVVMTSSFMMEEDVITMNRDRTGGGGRGQPCSKVYYETLTVKLVAVMTADSYRPVPILHNPQLTEPTLMGV